MKVRKEETWSVANKELTVDWLVSDKQKLVITASIFHLREIAKKAKRHVQWVTNRNID